MAKKSSFKVSNESRDLFISWLTISLAFALVLSKLNFNSFPKALAIAAVGVGTGFILHELAHKYVAIHYGAKAEFRAWRIGLILALALPILTLGNFLFAAPGAVYIFGKNISKQENGIVSLAGPLTNILIAIVFFSIGVAGVLPDIFFSVMFINLFLALFNMIPIFPLDGSKVFAWNVWIWGAVFFPLAVIVFFAP